MNCVICDAALGKSGGMGPDGELCGNCFQFSQQYDVALNGLEVTIREIMPLTVPDPLKAFNAAAVFLSRAARSPALRKRVMG